MHSLPYSGQRACMNNPDDELVRQAQSGDRQAFGTLVRRHQARVFHFVRRLQGGGDEALDISQEIFLKAWLALERWRPEARFHTWLLQIARNTTIDTLRRRQRQPLEPLESDDLLIDPGASPLRHLENTQRLTHLEQHLAHLALEHREILLLREVEGLSYIELAETLGVSEGTVKSRLARAREALLARYRHATGGLPHD